MLTVCEADEDLLAALKAGGRGHVLKRVGAGEPIEVLQGVMQARGPKPALETGAEDLGPRGPTAAALAARVRARE